MTMMITASDKERIWLDSCSATGYPVSTDFGEPDRYVFLGPDVYTGVGIVSRVDREGLIGLTAADAVTLVRDEAFDQGSAHLLFNEHWCVAAVGAALETSSVLRSLDG